MSAAEKKKLVDMCLVHGIPATDEQWLKFEPHFAVGGAKLRWNLRKMEESGELRALGEGASANDALKGTRNTKEFDVGLSANDALKRNQHLFK